MDRFGFLQTAAHNNGDDKTKNNDGRGTLHIAKDFTKSTNRGRDAGQVHGCLIDDTQMHRASETIAGSTGSKAPRLSGNNGGLNQTQIDKYAFCGGVVAPQRDRVGKGASTKNTSFKDALNDLEVYGPNFLYFMIESPSNGLRYSLK
ncbi:hypothetical protein KI387_001951, partial [Taxus chinensis]